MNGDRQRLAELYREVIIANAADPVGHHRRIAATHSATGDNPLCGDRVTLYLRVENQTLADAAFDGEACAICLASASLLCGHAPGAPVRVLRDSLAGFTAALRAGVDAGPGTACPEFLAPMLGVRDYPARIACATLPWETAIEALESPLGAAS